MPGITRELLSGRLTAALCVVAVSGQRVNDLQ